MTFETEQFKIGQAVRVVQSPAKPWTADWRDTYIVVGAQLDYQRGSGARINYSIATQDEIEHRLGATDDVFGDDMAPA